VSLESIVAGSVIRQGHPLEGAYVTLRGASGDFVGGIRTDETGRFQFYAAPGRWTLEVQVPGGSRTRDLTLQRADNQQVEVEV